MTIGLMANIDVSDLGAATEFYRKAFGMTLGRRLGARVVEMLGAAAPIYLLRKDSGTPASAATADRRRYERHWTPVHLDFVVDDVVAAADRAMRAGAQLEGEVETHEWGRIAHMADPFGNGFCLVQFLGRGYDEVTP